MFYVNFYAGLKFVMHTITEKYLEKSQHGIRIHIDEGHGLN